MEDPEASEAEVAEAVKTLTEAPGGAEGGGRSGCDPGTYGHARTHRYARTTQIRRSPRTRRNPQIHRSPRTRRSPRTLRTPLIHRISRIPRQLPENPELRINREPAAEAAREPARPPEMALLWQPWALPWDWGAAGAAGLVLYRKRVRR